MSQVISKGNREYVTIKIDTNMLAEMFEDTHGEYFKIKNKKHFAIDIANDIAEHLMNEGLEVVVENFADSGSVSIKEIEDEE